MRPRIELAGKPHPAQHLRDIGPDLALGPAGDAQWQGDILEGGEMGQQAEILKDHTDAAAQARQHATLRPADIDTLDKEPATAWPHGQVDQPEQAGLARAGRSHQPAKAPFGHLKGEVVQNLDRVRQPERLGAFLARLNRALRGFFHPAAGGDGLLWDLRQIPAVRDRTSLIGDPSRRHLAERVMDEAAAELLPRLPAFRAQVVHNDFNLSNVVVDEDPDVIAGALDFGDMLHAPLICDIATAAAYRWTPGEHPLEGVARFARGFDSVTQLEDEEIENLFILVGCRLALTLVLSNWQAIRFPEKIDYVLRGNEDLWSFLDSIAGISNAQATRMFRAALERR